MEDRAPEERRQFSRVGFDTPASLIQDDHEYQAKLEDISLNGVLIATPEIYHIRTDIPCTIKVFLSEDTFIVMQVTLVHSSNQFLGFHCTSIDMESISHLRRLIEINLGEEDASERVLGELLQRRQENN